MIDFAKNVGLAYDALWSYFPWLAEDDDAKQEALLGLWKAIQRFDPSKGFKFSTYAFATIIGYIKNYLEQQVTHGGPPTVSYDNPILWPDGGRDDEATYLERLAGSAPDPVEAAVTRATLDEVAPRVSKRRLLVVLLASFGRTQEEIAEHLGLSQAHVSRLLSGNEYTPRKFKKRRKPRRDRGTHRADAGLQETA